MPDPSFPLDHGHRGWREFTDWPGYFGQLQWYSRELDEDPYILGASIFTVAHDWQTFQLGREHALDLADFIASDEGPPSRPDRPRAWTCADIRVTSTGSSSGLVGTPSP
jgi:hypothetical protein